jgi:hypothetical protein
MRFGHYGKRITNPAELAAARRFYVPAECAQHIKCKTGDAEAWIWTEKGRFYAVGFLGRAQNPWTRRGGVGSVFSFKNQESRRQWVADLFECATSAANRTAQRKAEKAAARAKGHALQVGDVLRASWGYDQTNIDYYEVTKLIGSQMVEIREIGCQSQETMSMQGESVPAPGHYIGEPKRCKVSDYGERDSVKVSSCANAYKMKPQIIGGMKIYGASHWMAYA